MRVGKNLLMIWCENLKYKKMMQKKCSPDVILFREKYSAHDDLLYYMIELKLITK